MRPKVFVTRRIPEVGLKLLREKCDVEVSPEERPLSKEEIISGVQDKEGLVCLLNDPIDSEVMDAAPGLRVISNYAVGYNNIDVQAATARKIAVTNTPGVLTNATADLAWTLLMAAARRIVEADKFTREGKFGGWEPLLFLGADVFGKTLGIVGMGRIGQAVARRGTGFGMNIIYHSRKPKLQVERELGARRVELDELLRTADFISLHVPLTSDTRHLIDADALEKMKPSAILVNTARGAVVDEQALLEALRSGKIAGAGLDVFEEEPKITPGLAKLPNVVLAPHIGSATRATRNKMAEMVAHNVLAVFSGQQPPNLVNPEVWE